MRVSPDETKRIFQKIATKRKVDCTSFTFNKSCTVLQDGIYKGEYLVLTRAKSFAAKVKAEYPQSKVEVVEIRKTVHEFTV